MVCYCVGPFTKFYSKMNIKILQIIKRTAQISSIKIYLNLGRALELVSEGCGIAYLGTCPKNDVISFSRKRFYALKLGLELAEIRLNAFSVKRPFGLRASVLDPWDRTGFPRISN